MEKIYNTKGNLVCKAKDCKNKKKNGRCSLDVITKYHGVCVDFVFKGLHQGK